NFAGALATGTLWTNQHPTATAAAATQGASEAELPKALDPARVVEEEQVHRPEDVVRVLLDLYLPGGVCPETQAKLETFRAEGHPSGRALARRVREAVHAILTMAEYQLA